MIPSALITFDDSAEFEYDATNSYKCDVFEDMTRDETIIEVHDQVVSILHALNDKTPIRRIRIRTTTNGISGAWYSKKNPNQKSLIG
jgi:hypothetical protein